MKWLLLYLLVGLAFSIVWAMIRDYFDRLYPEAKVDRVGWAEVVTITLLWPVFCLIALASP